MSRILKILVLALLAASAQSAILSSTVSAQGTLKADALAFLVGEQTGELLQNAFTGVGMSTTCPGSTYVGHRYNATPHRAVPKEATTVTITPSYAPECKAHIPILGTRSVTVAMNGCDYVGHIGETTGGEGTYAATFDIVCPEGKAIDVEIYKLESTHEPANVICTVTIKAQTGLKGAHVKTTAEGADLDVSGPVEGIHEEHSGSVCGTGTSSTAKLDVDITVVGEIAPEVGLEISD